MCVPRAPRPVIGVLCLLTVLTPFIGASAQSSITFRDVAAERGVQAPDVVTRSVVWEDFDGDGDLDLVFGNIFAPNQLLRNDGTGHFEDVTVAWGIDSDLAEDSYGTNVADYDNDGDADIYFSNGGFNSLGVNRLYRNDGDITGSFTERAGPAGVAGPPSHNHAASWLDYDNDGLLDLVVHRRGAPSSLYQNQGDGTFIDQAPALGVDGHTGANGVCPGDFDNDGYVDIFYPSFPLAGFGSSSRLIRNRGDGTLVDITVNAGIDGPKRAFTCAVDDFNQDGLLDIFVATFNHSVDSNQEPSVLYINRGVGQGFVDLAADAGADIASNIMGLQSGDLNNDGLPDIYVGTGDPSSANRDILLLNQSDPVTGSVRFEDVSATSGILLVPPTRTHGMSFADFDRDGDVDLLVGMGGNMPTRGGGPIPGQEEPNRFWLNESAPGNGWLRYRLKGVISNRDGVDSRIVINAGDATFHRHVSGGNGFNTRNSFESIAGIGERNFIDRVWIRWPSGIVQRIDAPAMQSTHLWVETGLQAPPAASPGEQVTLRIAGPPNSNFRVFASPNKSDSQAPAGEIGLEEPGRIGSGVVPASGPGQLTVQLPTSVEPGGVFYLQATIRIEDSWYIANVVEIGVL